MAEINKAGRLVAITFASGILVSLAAGTTAFAQAGSTGGSVGKQDKSISGGEEQPAAPAVAQPSPNEAERAWAVTKDTTSPAVLQAFIRRFGKTVYGEMARARLDELNKRQITIINPRSTSPSTTVPGDKRTSSNPCSSVVGTWAWKWEGIVSGTKVAVFESDGTAHDDKGNHGPWTCTNGTLIVNWVTGPDTLVLSSDGRRLLGTGPWNVSVSAIRKQ
jgi:hypothetical protein